ncbi:MAG: Maf family protein [Hyphomicrobium sp.]|jgi:septum formation protein
MSARGREIVLASGSRARREMMAAAGVPFTVQAADVDEPAIRARLFRDDKHIGPKKVAEVLAIAKAEDVSSKRKGSVIIGADQVLALDDELLSKASSIESARETLQRLRGRTHELHSAVAFAEEGKANFTHVATARLTMRDFSDGFLDDYLTRAADRVTQTVGAYELEGLGIQLFEQIEGDYFTILGLPLLPVLAELRWRGIVAT